MNEEQWVLYLVLFPEILLQTLELLQLSLLLQLLWQSSVLLLQTFGLLYEHAQLQAQIVTLPSQHVLRTKTVMSSSSRKLCHLKCIALVFITVTTNSLIKCLIYCSWNNSLLSDSQCGNTSNWSNLLSWIFVAHSTGVSVQRKSFCCFATKMTKSKDFNTFSFTELISWWVCEFLHRQRVSDQGTFLVYSTPSSANLKHIAKELQVFSYRK